MNYRPFLVAATIMVTFVTGIADTVHGVVVDEGGKPIVGAVLRGSLVIRNKAQSQIITQIKAQSSSTGSFELIDVPSMPSSEHPIHLMARLPNGHFSVVYLTADNQQVTLSDRAARLRIHATDPNGKPVSGVAIRVTQVYSPTRDRPVDGNNSITYYAIWNGPDLALIATTDRDGFASFDGLPSGEHVLYSVEKSGLVHLDNSALMPASGDGSDGVVMTRAVALMGRVLSMGKPVSGVQVVASEGHNNTYERWLATTGSDGAYRIGDARAGSITLSVELGKLQSDFVAKPYQNLNVAEGGELDGLNFVLDKGIKVVGRVLTKGSDKPVPGAQVAISSDNGQAKRETTDVNGQFTVRIASGSVYVSVERIGGRPTDNQYNLSANVDSEHNPPLEIRVDDVAIYPPISHLTGVVVDTAGDPVANAIVRDLKSTAQATTDIKGEFRFENMTVPGDLVIATGADAMSKKAVQLSNQASITLVLDSKPALIQGSIIGEDGKPMSGVEVTLGGSESKSFYNFPRVTSDADGRFQFKGLYGGLDSFFVWAGKPGYGSSTIQPIKITPAEIKTLDPMKMLLADGTIDGKVLEADGTPAKGANVSSQTQESAMVQTDSEGNFHLKNVPRGEHFLSVGRGNTYWAGGPAATGQTNVVIKMSPAPKVEAGVVNQDKSGQVAPPLHIANWLNGKPIDLKELKGKIVVVDFWAVWCHPCVDAIPQVQALAEKYGSRGVVVIGVHVAGTPLAKVSDFVGKNHMTYLIGLDLADKSGLGASAAAYVPQGIPTVYVIGPNGRIASESNEVADAVKTIDKLLAVS